MGEDGVGVSESSGCDGRPGKAHTRGSTTTEGGGGGEEEIDDSTTGGRDAAGEGWGHLQRRTKTPRRHELHDRVRSERAGQGEVEGGDEAHGEVEVGHWQERRWQRALGGQKDRLGAPDGRTRERPRRDGPLGRRLARLVGGSQLPVATATARGEEDGERAVPEAAAAGRRRRARRREEAEDFRTARGAECDFGCVTFRYDRQPDRCVINCVMNYVTKAWLPGRRGGRGEEGGRRPPGYEGAAGARAKKRCTI